MSLKVTEGSPAVLGLRLDDAGANIAVLSAHAERIELCLFDPDGRETARLPLPGRTGDVRHAHVAGIEAGQRYALRAHGPWDPAGGHRFNPAKLLLDPWALVDEIERCRELGLEIDERRLGIAENTPLILPVHSALDHARERARGAEKIGTTGRGIGPAYEDKVARRAVRLSDLADEDRLRGALIELFRHHSALARGMGEPEPDFDEHLRMLQEVAPKVLPYRARVWQQLAEARRRRERVRPPRRAPAAREVRPEQAVPQQREA